MRQRLTPLLVAVSVVIGLVRCLGPGMDPPHELAIELILGVWVAALLACYFVAGRSVCLYLAAGLTLTEAVMGLVSLLR